ncbi:MAG: DUF6468 domain-containing protein [Acetobacter sp.]|uniref:DUF6468 domain-containing protein n=1 Tax=Acetobacter sp. TaxID=440 RepID=UPI003CFE4BA2
MTVSGALFANPVRLKDTKQMLTQIQMIIEVVLSIFLFLGIVYSFYLGRVLSNLKRDRESLLGLVEKLESSVKSADQGVEKLRIAGEVSGRPLSRMVEQAKLAGVELDGVVSKADAAADRLEALVTQLPVQEKRLENLIEKAGDLRLERLREEKMATQEEPQAEAPAADDAAKTDTPPRNQLEGKPPASETSTAEPAGVQKEIPQLPVPKKADATGGDGKKNDPAPPRSAGGKADSSTSLATSGKPSSGNVRVRRRPYMQVLEQTFLGRQGE